jgi:putative photosynthetic complex assembly protein
MDAPAQQPKRLTPPPILGAAVLLAATLIAVVGVRLAHAPPAAMEPQAAVIMQRDLRFVDLAGGAIDVIDVQHPERSQRLLPGTESDGFLRATVRALARERKRQGGDDVTPFRLSALADGRLVLEDLATGHRVDLEAFGHTNAGRFARLLLAGEPLRQASAGPATQPPQR